MYCMQFERVKLRYLYAEWSTWPSQAHEGKIAYLKKNKTKKTCYLIYNETKICASSIPFKKL